MKSKMIFFLQGPASVGKSTFLFEHGLEHLVVSKDFIRLQVGEVMINEEIDHLGISQAYNGAMERILLDTLRHRLEHDLLTIVDATHTKYSDFEAYTPIVMRNNFDSFIARINPEVTVEEALARNEGRRGTYAYVPAGVVIKKFEELENFKPPVWCNVITQEVMISLIRGQDKKGIIKRIMEARKCQK